MIKNILRESTFKKDQLHFYVIAEESKNYEWIR